MLYETDDRRSVLERTRKELESLLPGYFLKVGKYLNGKNVEVYWIKSPDNSVMEVVNSG